MQRAKTILL